ncbi:MAG TPA: D-aminoacyl-tRNA deacylase [archaeon]|nr:D-aminoacyl-tRNA deacylase [archaeon]
MLFSIIVSKTDSAGMNFRSLFIESFGFKETEREFQGNKIFSFKNFELVTIDSSQVFADFLSELKTDFFVFASKHGSKSGKPSLTVHSIGNFSRAELGGKDFSLVPASAFLSANYLLSLKEKQLSQNLQGFDVSLEATHHGPFLEKPAIFIELGSSEKEWQLKKPAEAICETILEKTSLRSDAVPCIGIGGGHYSPSFTKRIFSENLAFSHIAAEYAMPFFNENSLREMLSKSIEKTQRIVVDKKGIGKSEQKNRVKKILEAQEIEVQWV